MTNALVDLIKNTVILKLKLPCDMHDIKKSCITSTYDDCFESIDDNNLNKIIYESILYYSFDEFQLHDGDQQKMFINAFNRKFKYNHKATPLAKRRLGIYGESLLYSILKCHYGADALISRGYFYDIQKKSEVTGYDAFHIIDNNDEVELWFGETKFYEDYEGAVDSVCEKINIAISDDYLINTNLVAILQRKGNLLSEKMKQILERWEKCIIDSLEEELRSNKIKLIYPILITFNKTNNDYIELIKEVVDYINDKFKSVNLEHISIDYSVFFILLPITDVQTCKETIIKWIDEKKPLELL